METASWRKRKDRSYQREKNYILTRDQPFRDRELAWIELSERALKGEEKVVRWTIPQAEAPGHGKGISPNPYTPVPQATDRSPGLPSRNAIQRRFAPPKACGYGESGKFSITMSSAVPAVLKSWQASVFALHFASFWLR